MSPVYKSPSECADACKKLPGCNSWSFCNNLGTGIIGEGPGKGCGSGCPEYVKSNPTGKLLSTTLSESTLPLQLPAGNCMYIHIVTE